MAGSDARKEIIKRLSFKRIANSLVQKAKRVENEYQKIEAEESNETQYGEQTVHTVIDDGISVAGDVTLDAVQSSFGLNKVKEAYVTSEYSDAPPDQPEGHISGVNAERQSQVASTQKAVRNKHLAEKRVAVSNGTTKQANQVAVPEQPQNANQADSTLRTRLQRLRQQVAHRRAVEQYMQKTSPELVKAARMSSSGGRSSAATGMRQMAREAWQKIKVLIAKAVAKAGSSIGVVLLCGVIILLVALMLGCIVAIVGSPMAILFSGEAEDPTSIPMSSIVREINAEFTQEITNLIAQHPECDEVNTRYVYAPGTSWSSYWPEIIALYAVDANLSAGEDVVVIDGESKVRIRQMFWRMHRIESYVEQIEIPQEIPEEPELPEDESASSVAEPTMPPPLYRYVLHITVSGKSVYEIVSLLGFSAEQNEILNELLSESMRPSLISLCAGVSAGAISWPLPGYSNITTIFGVDDAFGNPGHKGIDIAAPEWTPIYAAHSGTVTLNAWSDSYGNQVVLDNGMGLTLSTNINIYQQK